MPDGPMLFEPFIAQSLARLRTSAQTSLDWRMLIGRGATSSGGPYAVIAVWREGGYKDVMESRYRTDQWYWTTLGSAPYAAVERTKNVLGDLVE